MKDKILDWAFARGLHTGDKSRQMLKLMEETGELAAAVARYNIDGIIDSIGDIYVVLVILAMQFGLNIDDCIREAYEEIKDRKGKLINGVFVKEEDLKKGGNNG
jgi:NTP pyrophosphatase (non-canonical NTP hydrolase)